MKNVLILSLFLLVLGCKEESNPVNSNSNSLEGNWNTNGINEMDIDGEVGLSGNITFTQTKYTYSWTVYEKTNGQWVPENTQKGDWFYRIDNSFIVLTDQHGASNGSYGQWHYIIEGNKLTLNSPDIGGIYNGSSNSLTGSIWIKEESIYDTSSKKIKYRYEKYSFHDNGSGYYIDDIDSTFFSYELSNNVITMTRNSHISVAIYEIKNHKLYMYGKPKTSSNDDYAEFIFYRTN